MANHSFNITLAEKYGVEQAILIEHIYWWVHKNECDGIEDMVKDGKVWCRSTAKGFAKYIPYLKPDKIWRILRKMEGHILLVGNFNKQALNQTLWYTFTDEFKKELEDLNYDFENFKNANLKNEKSNNSIINNPINKENKIKENREKELSNNNSKKRENFIKPTIEDIDEYIRGKNLSFSAELFYDHYESNGWMVGRNKMKDWKAACRNWERMRNSNQEEEKEEEPNPYAKWPEQKSWIEKNCPNLVSVLTKEEIRYLRYSTSPEEMSRILRYLNDNGYEGDFDEAFQKAKEIWIDD